MSGKKQKLLRELIKRQYFLVFIVCHIVCVSKESLLILPWGKHVVSFHLQFWWEGICILLYGIWHIVNGLWEESTVSKDCQNLVWIKSWLVKGDVIREGYSLYSGSVSIMLSPSLCNLSLELGWNERELGCSKTWGFLLALTYFPVRISRQIMNDSRTVIYFCPASFCAW